MVYDLESLLKHTMKSALEKALKQISLYDVLFPSSSVDESFDYSYSAQKADADADEDSKKSKKQKSRKGEKINYPKCAYPGCEKNRFARGKGFCGEHYKMYLAGEAKSADEYMGAE